MLVNNTYKCKNDTIALFYAVYFPLRDGCKKGKGRGGGEGQNTMGKREKGAFSIYCWSRSRTKAFLSSEN